MCGHNGSDSDSDEYKTKDRGLSEKNDESHRNDGKEETNGSDSDSDED